MSEAGEITLEGALGRLEQITRELESGDLELAASLELYEEGVRLLRIAEGLLGRAEGRIEQLRADGTLTPFREEGQGT